MFDNAIDPIQWNGQIVLSHHLLGNWDQMLPAHLHVQMLFFGLIGAFATIVGLSIYQYYQWEYHDKKKVFRVLPNYTTSLNLETSEDFYRDETLYREKGGYTILTD